MSAPSRMEDAEEQHARRASDGEAHQGSTDAEHHARPLEVQEVVEKLNTVPAFKVVDDETGDIVPTPGKGGEACLCWYADPHDARVALAIVAAREPGRQLSLGTTPLGTALAMSEGWGTGLPSMPLRLQASSAVLRSVRDVLSPLPERAAAALNARTSAFPVFLMEELQSPSVAPVFFRREDLASCWRISGRAPEALPDSLTLYDLRVLVLKMMSTGADWRSLMFVAPGSSLQHIDAASQHGAVRDLERQAAVARGDEPPPLEEAAAIA